jgi:hypothetical protein
MNNYNSKKYIELVKYNQYLIKQGTNLEKQNREKYLELVKYSVKLSDHVHWKKRTDYLNLMKDFVNFKISGKEFETQFLNIFQTREKIVKTLINDLNQLTSFEPNPLSFGFSEFISDIEVSCDEFYLEAGENDGFGRDEKSLRTFIADIIPQVQKYIA